MSNINIYARFISQIIFTLALCVTGIVMIIKDYVTQSPTFWLGIIFMIISVTLWIPSPKKPKTLSEKLAKYKTILESIGINTESGASVDGRRSPPSVDGRRSPPSVDGRRSPPSVEKLIKNIIDSRDSHNSPKDEDDDILTNVVTSLDGRNDEDYQNTSSIENLNNEV